MAVEQTSSTEGAEKKAPRKRLGRRKSAKKRASTSKVIETTDEPVAPAPKGEDQSSADAPKKTARPARRKKKIGKVAAAEDNAQARAQANAQKSESSEEMAEQPADTNDSAEAKSPTGTKKKVVRRRKKKAVSPPVQTRESNESPDQNAGEEASPAPKTSKNRRPRRTKKTAKSEEDGSPSSPGENSPATDAEGDSAALDLKPTKPSRRRRPQRQKQAEAETPAAETADDRSSRDEWVRSPSGSKPGKAVRRDDDAFGAGLGESLKSSNSRAQSNRRAAPANGRDAKQAESRTSRDKTETDHRPNKRPAPVEKQDDSKLDPKKKRTSSPGGRSRRKSKVSRPSAPEETGSALDDDSSDAPSAGAGRCEMMINASTGDECRIAVLESGRLEELYIERNSAESHVGGIYKGKVTNIEPSIQAVFVDFGQAKNGFLHISDVHPQYFPEGGKDSSEEVGKKIPRRNRPPIQRCFRRGQEVVVQVTKEGVGTKGPTLTSYLSIPGRFLVMMPGMKRLGVSRRIEDEDSRRHMRDILNELELPEGMGFILRTAGLDRSKRELQRDLNYLNRLWRIIAERVRKTRAPAELYRESDLVIRTMRDVLTADFKRIVIDDPKTAETAREFLRIALPRTQDIVELYEGPEPIFHKFGIEDEIDKINVRKVPLPLGGSIVIDSTEAMVAIDVNSGRFRQIADAEESALRVNLEAAEEIARQLRLRDLGGLVVCDFIDLREDRNKRAVERCLRNALKKHKERARILRMSQFGLIEMTRQRQRSSIRQSIFTECTHCSGAGMVKSAESMVLEVLRVLQLAAHTGDVSRIALTVAPEVASMVQNQKRSQLIKLEQDTGTTISILPDAHQSVDDLTCECRDARGRIIPSPA